MAIKLLQTKLNRPLLPDDFVERERLLDILERSTTYKLVLVSAPAGYGKSMLISQWLESQQEPNTWLSLDAEDNNLMVFVEYVVAAVQRLFPKACSGTQALLESLSPSLTKALPKSLISELDEIELPFILVLDDYHRIHEPAVHALLSQMLRYPPRPLKLVILTRRDPPLPLANLRAQGKIIEIRLQDLRFTPRETSTFLEHTLNCQLEEEILNHLDEQLEGWAVGIRLLSLVLPYQADQNKFLATLSDQLSPVLDYLVEEVLVTQPAAVREGLKQTAILERFSLPLVEALCQLDNPISLSKSDRLTFLKALKAGSLLIIPLTEGGGWYCYHHLFQRLLQKQLKCDSSPEAIAALHKRASAWFEAQNLLEEAINHALKAGDTIGAAQIVERHRITEMNADRWNRLDKWLSRLPKAVILQRVQLLLCQGWILYFRYRLTEIPTIIEQVEMGFPDEASESALLAELNTLKGIIYFWEGRGERSLEYFEKGLGRHPKTAHFIRAETELYLGLTRYIVGQRKMAIRFLNNRLCQLGLKEFSSRFRLMGGLLFIQTLSGNLPQGLETARQMEKIGKTNDSLYAETWGHYLQAAAHLRANELDKALPHFCFVADKQYFIDPRAAIDALVGLALTYQALQQPNAATETVAQLVELAWEIGEPDLLSVAHSAQARLALLQGDLPSVVKWGKSFNEAPHFPTMFFWLEVPQITKARALVAVNSDKSLQEATELLREIWEGTKALHYTCQIIEIEVLQSLALEKQGNREEALAILKSGLALAEPGGVMRPFIELGSPMSELLRRLHQQDSKSYFIRQLLKALQVPTIQSTINVQTSVETLTQREAEILEMLSQRLHDKEIARHLCISTTTVKSHLRHLYQKLDVHNRRQAVVRAHDLGLLSVGH